MSFLYPELLLLALPTAWLLLRFDEPRRFGFWLRAAACLALLGALAGPQGGGATTGRDLVLLVDRSRSMPADAGREVVEVLGLLEPQLESDDRVAVVAFGADSAIERQSAVGTDFAGFRSGLDVDGSQLADALERALALIPENRPGSILLFSDGEFHGRDPEGIARRAGLREVRIDVRAVLRDAGLDVAVDRLELPEEVAVGEPFQFTGWVRSDRPVEVGYTLHRDGEPISSGRKELRAGLNPVLFRDLGRGAGIAHYRLELEVDDDRVAENDRGLGVVRVQGERPVLVLNEGGVAGRLVAALRGAGIPAVALAPEALPRPLGPALDRFRAVVLENVPAQALGFEGLRDLRLRVEELGGGLLMTGGPASFGVGGYFRSQLEEVLPVTMEIRQEHRKMALALSVVLDRSGSMAVPVDGGRTKMDLANAGTLEAARVLGPIDELSVIAVDSEAHLVVPHTRIGSGGVASKIQGVEAGGGGIYVFNGLRAAAAQLEQARALNRHIILFADAADSEQPGGYVALIEKLRATNTTVSVVALGTEQDSDAGFLKDIAARGGGEIYFTTTARELPQLFAQDTLLAARSSFIDTPTATEVTAGILTVADLQPGLWNTLPGYNLTYLRPGATLGVVTRDEYTAPVVATMQAGLGRAAAFSGQVQGERGVPAADWPATAELLVSVVRWLSGQEPPAAYFPSIRREGREAVLSVEVDPEALEGGRDRLEARVVAPDGARQGVILEPVGSDRFEARLPLGMEGVYQFAARTGPEEVLPLPPLAVPYSPEFEPRSQSTEGERVLGRIARLSGGSMNPPVTEIAAGSRTGTAIRPWARWFVLAALLLFLSEVAWRRLFEGSVRRRPAPAAAEPRSRATRPARPRPQRKEAPEPAPEPPEPVRQPGLGSALSRAKRRSEERTQR